MNTQLLFHHHILLLAICFLTVHPTFAQSNKLVANNPEFSYHKNTSLVYSVDPKTNGINRIFLKRENVESQLYELKGDCYRCEYYLGTVEGSIKLAGNKIVKGKNCRFTINTQENLMSGQYYFPGNQYLPGVSYTLAGMNTIVVSNQKGKFIVEMK